MSKLQRILGSIVWDWVFRLIAAGSLVVAAVALVEQNNLSECVANYNDINNRRTRIITEVTDQERRAERQADDAQNALFLSPIVSIPSDERTPEQRAELLKLFSQYQDALRTQIKEREEADNTRRANPVPPPPSELCG